MRNVLLELLGLDRWFMKKILYDENDEEMRKVFIKLLGGLDRWWIWRCLESSARCYNSKYDFITPPHLILHIFVNSSSSSSLLSSYSSSSPSPPPHQSAAFDRQPSHTCLKQQLSSSTLLNYALNGALGDILLASSNSFETFNAPPPPSSFFGLEVLQGHLFCFIIALYFLVYGRGKFHHSRHMQEMQQTSCFCRQKVCYPVLFFAQSQHSPNFLQPHQEIRIPQKNRT